MDFALNINHEELKLGREIPTLFKLRLKKLLSQNPGPRGGRILVVDTCIIGDFLATLPALRLFIEKNGGGVDLVVSPPLRHLAQAIRGVDRVFTARSVYDRPLEKAAGEAPVPGDYGKVLVLRISGEAYRLLDGINAEILTYDVPYFKYFGHLVKTSLLKRPVRQWREVNYEMIGEKEPAVRPGFDEIFKFGDEEYAEAARLPALDGPGRKVMIHSGSGWSVKLWDDEKWAGLLRKIHDSGDYRFIFIGGGAREERSFERIQSLVDFKLHSLVNKADLREVLVAMRQCDYFIGIDSGPRNMAHLADLRSVSLLGPAPRNFMPVDPRDIVIDKFDCRCKSLFYLHKVSGMQKISADEVFESFKKLAAAPPDVTAPLSREPVAAA